MNGRSRHLVATAALTVAALLILSGTRHVAALVVCVGMDGHVEIETMFDGCCISNAPGVRSDSVVLSIGSSHCGTCTDVELKIPLLRPDEDLPLQPVGDSGGVLDSRCASAEFTTRALDFTVVDQPWRALSTLSTVVLLT